MALTTEQEAVVAARDGDVLVTAGAGSGKTHVLVERYLALLADCTIPQIAAVTFTDAAATEMRQRVRQQVMTRPDLERHRSDLDEAVIGTIHALCRQLLRQYPFEAGIDPAAPVLPDDEAEFELLAACLDALEAAAADDGGAALRAVQAIGVSPLMEALPTLVARRDEVAAAFAALPGDNVDGWTTHVRARLDAALEASVAALLPVIRAAVAEAQALRSGQDKLSAAVDALLAVIDHQPPYDPNALVARLADVRPPLNVGTGAAWSNRASDARAALRTARDAMDALIPLPRWNEADEESLSVLDGLRALFDDACERYAARKRALGGLDYLDLELEAARLLETHPEVARRCRQAFRHVMVDEFQDTSPLQMRVIDLLVGRSAPIEDAPRPQLFVVGDAKQAIYRFRGSDVRQFNRVHASIDAVGGAVLRLTRSFRTHDPLVEVLNDLFDAVLGDGTRDFEAPMQRMTGRGGDAPAAPHLTLIPVGTSDPAGERVPEEAARRVEADLVAAEVERLLAAAEPVWDNRARCYRAPVASDVAILLRRLTNVHLFERALEARGVPYRTPAGAGFFTRPEVLDLTNLLAWLAEPDDAIALVGVLRSPLFLLDDLTLLHLAQAGGGWMRVLREPPAVVADVEMRERCAHAAQVLTDLRTLAAHAAVDAVLEAALQRTGYEAVWAPLAGGDQALANIRKFVGMARTLAGRSLDEFVQYVVRRRDELTVREGQAVLDDTEAVRILTIHGAKGLDWPIVVVPEAHLDPRDTNLYVRFRTEDGIAFTLVTDADAEDRRRPRSGFYQLLHDLDREEEKAEHHRLFYVAATRAADRLIVSGAEGKGWLGAATEAVGAHASVEVRPTAVVDLDALARRPARERVTVPDAAREVEVDPPLVARPRVIPLRASTPVTALRPRAEHASYAGHGDGLALVRGVLAHRALELWHTQGARPDLARTLDAIDDGALDAPVRAQVVAEVDAMLDTFATGDLAATLRDPGTQAWFEFPFAWDWDGVPVHGTLDLLYRQGDEWHIVDFKTDDLRGRSPEEVGAPYLSQLGLYAGALERATGRVPTASLAFLRTGQRYTPSRADLAAALVATRAEIDDGVQRAVDPDALDSIEA
ncbi:MAG: UvrD-helicase domain-containing protein [Dehalococcoidia bacterium]